MPAHRPLWKSLRVGDRVRLVEFPPEFLTPGFVLFPETKRVYQKLLRRNRPLLVGWIEDGQPWTRVRFRRSNGGWEEHSLALSHGGLIRVRSRPAHHTQTVSCKDLRPGDWIRIVAIPPQFLRPGYCFHRDTKRLYERLIRLRRHVKVDWIDDWGYPWITYHHRDAKGRWQWHGLMIGEHDLFVRVSHRPKRAT